MRARINVNDEVWIRLTDRGRSIYEQHWRSQEMEPVALKEEDGCVRMQLWQAMSVFGAHFVHGGELPFETVVEIEFEPAELECVAELEAQRARLAAELQLGVLRQACIIHKLRDDLCILCETCWPRGTTPKHDPDCVLARMTRPRARRDAEELPFEPGVELEVVEQRPELRAGWRVLIERPDGAVYSCRRDSQEFEPGVVRWHIGRKRDPEGWYAWSSNEPNTPDLDAAMRRAEEICPIAERMPKTGDAPCAHRNALHLAGDNDGAIYVVAASVSLDDSDSAWCPACGAICLPYLPWTPPTRVAP